MIKRRTKENTKYWSDRMERLFNLNPDYKKVTKRYDTLKIMLQEKYPFIKDNDNIQFLKDVIHLDRILRLETMDVDVEDKMILSQEYQLAMDSLR